MNSLKKIKALLDKKIERRPTFGTDPNEPWSARAGITEGRKGLLDQYLSSRGINPKFISKYTRISHAKSTQFQQWKKDHMVEQVSEDITTHHTPFEVRQHALKKAKHIQAVQRADVPSAGIQQEAVDKEDTITFDIPLLIRMFEYAREDAKTDMDLHKVTEKLISIRDKGTLTMADYDFIVKLKEELDLSEGAFKRMATDREEDARLKKMSALDKFRADAAAREKKHAEIEKKSGGMTSAIDRLQAHLNKEESDLHKRAEKFFKDKEKKPHYKQLKPIQHQSQIELKNKQKLNKEETEQIDELKKSTVKSWLGQQSVVPPKKPGIDRKAHNQRIKTRSKSWDRALDRLSGHKPTSEDVYQDSQAATQTAFDMGTQADDREPDCSCDKKKQMSKSARMIKALYKKHKMVKEDLYDHEKEDKSVATYGKKPKVEKEENQTGGDEQAAMVLSGGKTLTGQKRDTLEIDPMMRKPNKQDTIDGTNNKKTDK